MSDLEIKLARANGVVDELYSQRCVELIREKYTADEEYKLTRHKLMGNAEYDEAYEEFNEYVEQCIAQAHEEIYGE